MTPGYSLAVHERATSAPSNSQIQGFLPCYTAAISGIYRNFEMWCLFRDLWAESWLGNPPHLVYIYLFWLRPRCLRAHQTLKRRPLSVKASLLHMNDERV